MLKLLAEFLALFHASQCLSLHHLPYGRRHRHGAAVRVLLRPVAISSLRLKQGRGQPIRDDGPQSHLVQARHAHHGRPDDPLGPVRLRPAVGQPHQPLVWSVLFVTLGFGAIGFYDDYLKVTKQSHKGFSGRNACPSNLPSLDCRHRNVAGRRRTTISALACDAGPLFATSLRLPFFKDLLINLAYFFHPVRRLYRRRLRQCGEPDRWPGWPRHRAGDGGGGRVSASSPISPAT